MCKGQKMGIKIQNDIKNPIKEPSILLIVLELRLDVKPMANYPDNLIIPIIMLLRS